RDRTGDVRPGTLRRVDDFRRGLVEKSEVIRLESDPDLVLDHGHSYSTTSLMVPAPTVRPPSRIANRNPFSIAIGVINSTSTAMLSPGITISTPAGICTDPVTSVVRK